MSPHELVDSILAAAAIASTILLLGALFLLILRTDRGQFSFRFLLWGIGSIALSLGLWTAVLRYISTPETSDSAPAPEQTPAEYHQTEPSHEPAGDLHQRPPGNPESHSRDELIESPGSEPPDESH